ncbi:MAG TPA: alcohol dehydrogenase catalytic domain-containing protein [Streptosporangiaceae bacterium]|nr:alcohol dehydrogenase catalytic domain-containing protein [Streptosporangiaceae bacterium]
MSGIPAVMRGAVYHGPGDVRVASAVPVPEPGPGEVLIKVTVAGVCGSDAAEYVRPRLIPTGPDGSILAASGGVVLGHEFAGEVAAAGPGVPGDLLGQRVACGAGISCGTCAMCAQARTNLCVSYHTLGFQRDGGMAEYVTAPASICLPAGDRGLSADTIALAQPMAIAVHARSRGQVGNGQTVLVIGAGGIGLFLAYACASVGAQVWVADLAEDRLALARALGAAQVVDSRSVESADALAGAGVRASVIFEVSGSAAGLDSALRAARPGARVVAVGVQEAASQARFAEWTLGEYDILGTVAHVCETDLPHALDLLAEGGAIWAGLAPDVLPLEALVSEGLVPLGAGGAARGAGGAADGAGGAARVKTLFDPSASHPRVADHGRWLRTYAFPADRALCRGGRAAGCDNQPVIGGWLPQPSEA